MRRLIISALCVLFICSCTRDLKITGSSDTSPEIFPDYRNVTVPYDIAPLNFMIEGEKDWVLKIESEDNVRFVQADNGLFTFRGRFWKSLLKANKGSYITLTICFRDEGGWISCGPFRINVAEEGMDPYIVYRLIPP